VLIYTEEHVPNKHNFGMLLRVPPTREKIEEFQKLFGIPPQLVEGGELNIFM